MAVTKTLISNSPGKCTFKVTGTAAADTTTITLADMAHTNNGTAFTPTKANITGLKFTCAATGDITVVRNAVTIAKLFGCGDLNAFGFAEQNTQSTVITFNTTAGGTLIIEFGKTP